MSAISSIFTTRLVLDAEGRSKAIAVLLDRPSAANALSGDMLDSLAAELKRAREELQKDPTIRCLILAGRGRHFCAGADLAWMQQSAALSHAENLADASRLTAVFEALANFPRPTIAVVRGAAYGGAVGLIACCDIVIAEDTSKFCLSEARLGLIPAVIMPYLTRRIAPGFLRRAALTSRVIAAEEAKSCGLVDIITAPSEVNEALRNEIDQVLQAGPAAQAAVKELIEKVRMNKGAQGEYTAQAIAAARTGPEGQAGLTAFFSRTPAPWSTKTSEALNFSQLMAQESQ